jgi:AcrR family transcriptional regulator
VTVDNLTDSLARRAVERSVADRRASYVQEMQRIIEATYRVIERTGGVDPTLRDILRESGLSTQAFYKHFRTKDELLLVLLDDGRRQLLSYLNHRMSAADTPEGQIRAWIEGVLMQANHPDAAARTRPFLANQERLAEHFPAEQQASVDLVVAALASAVEGTRAAGGRSRREARRDALAIYHLCFGALRGHLAARTRPTAGEIDHLVRFSLNAIRERGGADGR